MSKKLVSVCIPAYNNADYIHETIESIMEQTYKNWELIIVDDASSDNTFSVIKEYEALDERIHVYQNEKNLGMSGNWNKCLSLCTGDYIKLCGADDMLVKRTLEIEVKVLNRYPSANFVCSDTKLKDLNGNPKGVYRRYRAKGLIEGKKVVKKGFFSQNYFGAPQAVTFRKSVLDTVKGFDPYYTYILDYDFMTGIAMLGDIYIVHKPLNIFRVRGDSNTGQVMGKDKAKLDIYLKEHYNLFNKYKDELGLSDREIKACMMIRRARCFAASWYLRLFVR